MEYTKQKFTLPAANPATSDKNWDRAFLSAEAFRLKYNEEPKPEDN